MAAAAVAGTPEPHILRPFIAFCSTPAMIPRLFTRYLIWELGRVFLVALTLLTLLMVMVGVIQESVREGLTPITILRLVPYTLPNALCFAIPGTALFSVCNVLGRMSADNEIVALKSAGLPPALILWPLVVAAFVLSLCTVVLNDFAVSWGRQGIYRVVLHSVQNTIYARLNAELSYRRDNVSITVDSVDGLDLQGLVVEFVGSKDQPPFYLTAQRARLELDADRNELLITTEQGYLQGGGAAMHSDQDQFPLALEQVTKKQDKSRSPSNLPLRMISHASHAQRRVVDELQQQMAIEAAVQGMGGDTLAMADERWSAAVAELDAARYRQHRLRAEPWRRWANGFSCLFFVLVGAPLAIRLQKADFWTIFAACFIPILLVYYPLVMLGVGYAKEGLWHPASVWLGNGVLALAAVWLMAKVRRH